MTACGLLEAVESVPGERLQQFQLPPVHGGQTPPKCALGKRAAQVSGARVLVESVTLGWVDTVNEILTPHAGCSTASHANARANEGMP